MGEIVVSIVLFKKCKMIKTFRKFIALFCLTAIMTSCYTTQVTVGDISSNARTARYSKSKQFYVFWGVVPLGKNEPKAPANTAYIVESKFKFGDFLLSRLTGGIVGSRTSMVYVEK